MATSILGLARLRKKLDRLPDVAKREIVAAMEKSAQEIVDLAKSLAPVDSGDLRRSIGWTWGDPPKGLLVLATSSPVETKTGKLKLSIYAGNDKAFYARWVEFGAVAHSVSKGGGTVAGKAIGGTAHPGAKAQPFFFPAYRANKKRAKGRITRAINKAAKKVAAGG